MNDLIFKDENAEKLFETDLLTTEKYRGRFTELLDNNPKAIAQLKDRFGRGDIFVRIYVRDLLSKIIKNAVSGHVTTYLPSLYDELESKIRALESLGRIQEKYGDFLSPLVESCLLEEILVAWERFRNLKEAADTENVPWNNYLVLLTKKWPRQENTIERHHYGGAGWRAGGAGGNIFCSRIHLHVQSVTMKGHIYRDVILEQHVRLFWGAMGAEFLFMEGNTRPYRENIVDECFQTEDITRKDWPAYSPDMNPIEHVYDMLVDELQPVNPLPPVYRNFGGHCFMSGVIFPKIRLII
ncbi:transposable element Tcb1 transposase [Trichonephila clavipes]|nr:transposable element Tcb1 transposase [Trichonephila clavipes]